MLKNNERLEAEADKILAPFLKDKKKNKVSTSEYPILSESQLKRRRAKEIPFSNLSLKQRLIAEGPAETDD